MALKQGRQGILGLAVENTPGTPVAATTVIPFTVNTLQGKSQPFSDIAARGSRVQDANSFIGKQWGEGDVTVNVDTLNIGYLFKLVTGNEVVSNPSTGVYQHLFYTTVSGNTPLTATLYNYQGVDVQQYASMAVDKFDLEVKDKEMTAKVMFKGFFPTSGAVTNQTVSGTLLQFNDYQIQLGSNLVNAGAASKASISEFKLSIANNADTVFESGQSRPTRIFWKQLKVEGEFTRYFETTTDRDNYLNLSKQSLIMTASGSPLPGNNVEQITINLARLSWTDQKWDTALENFFAVTTHFVAEFDPTQGKQYDVTLQNYRSTAYT